jgi:uncharacterized DUF497 family protein
MQVTFDPAKDEINIAKHGVSLKRAEDFGFETALYKHDDSQDYGQVRYNLTGWLDALLYRLTFTEEHENIRAISLRKATRKERELYAEES